MTISACAQRESEPHGRLNCLTCRHHVFDLNNDLIRCTHPKRPEEARVVVQWYRGCVEHRLKVMP